MSGRGSAQRDFVWPAEILLLGKICSAINFIGSQTFAPNLLFQTHIIVECTFPSHPSIKWCIYKHLLAAQVSRMSCTQELLTKGSLMRHWHSKNSQYRYLCSMTQFHLCSKIRYFAAPITNTSWLLAVGCSRVAWHNLPHARSRLMEVQTNNQKFISFYGEIIHW